MDIANLIGRRLLPFTNPRVVSPPGHPKRHGRPNLIVATPMRSGTLRLVQNITFRRADCEWISTLHVGWAWKAYRRDKFLERLIAGADLAQRAVLGFPQPDSDYWTEGTIAAVEARHGVFGMDMTPYRQALVRRQG